MAFRKFQADQLFTGYKMLNREQVLITDERGIVEEIIDLRDAGDDVQQLSGILSPGLINCHCHLELSHMRGLIPEQTGLIDFVFKVVTQRHFGDAEILEAIAKAEDEMLANGIVAVGDICNNTLTLSQKRKGRLAYYNFIEASGWLPGVAEERFNRSKLYYDQFAQTSAHNSIVPHAPYSVSELLWQQITPYFQNKVVSIHNQETIFEDELFLKGTGDFVRMYEMMKIDNGHHVATGKTSLRSYLPKLTTAANILLVHNTYTTGDDIQFANQQAAEADTSLFWCLCINANRYIENSVPPVKELLSNNANIVLGTDSLASNWSLSILDEIRSIRESFTSVSLEQMLTWATINGAKALNMADNLGSFEKGKQPGVVLFNDELDQVRRLI